MYKANEKSKAICTHCEKLVATTFQYRDIPFPSLTGMVNNILVAVCNECNSVVAIPAQSTEEIKNQKEKLCQKTTLI